MELNTAWGRCLFSSLGGHVSYIMIRTGSLFDVPEGEMGDGAVSGCFFIWAWFGPQWRNCTVLFLCSDYKTWERYMRKRLKQNWSFPQPGYGFALEHCIGKHTRGWFLVFAACNPNLSCRAVPCCTAWPSGIKGTMTKWTECQQGCSVTVWQAAQVAPCGLVCYCLLQWRHQGRAKAREDPFSAIPYPSPENMTLFWQLMSD